MIRLDRKCSRTFFIVLVFSSIGVPLLMIMRKFQLESHVIIQVPEESLSDVDDWQSQVNSRLGVLSTMNHYVDRLNATNEQVRRQKRLAEVCAKYKLSPSKVFDEDGRSFFAEKRLRYFYCNVPKVACSTWTLVLAKANGLPDRNQSGPVAHSNEIDKFVPPFRFFPKNERRDLWRNNFRFMFTRHPFERLVSAYHNKFVEMGRGKGFRAVDHFLKIAADIKRRFRRKGTRKSSKVKFHEFVSYVLDRRAERRKLDCHWRPMNELCKPCSVGYDFLGHYETLLDDANIVLDNLRGVNRTLIKFPSAAEYGRRNSSDRVSQAFSQLSPKQIKGLRRLYHMDFELFGYE